MKIIALNTYTPDINDFAYEWNPKRLCKAISTQIFPAVKFITKTLKMSNNRLNKSAAVVFFFYAFFDLMKTHWKQISVYESLL